MQAERRFLSNVGYFQPLRGSLLQLDNVVLSGQLMDHYCLVRCHKTSGKCPSPPPPNHLPNPDRRERRRAAFGCWVVAEDAQHLADDDGSFAMLREVDADFGEAIIHSPLHMLGRDEVGSLLDGLRDGPG